MVVFLEVLGLGADFTGGADVVFGGDAAGLVDIFCLVVEDSLGICVAVYFFWEQLRFWIVISSRPNSSLYNLAIFNPLPHKLRKLIKPFKLIYSTLHDHSLFKQSSFLRIYLLILAGKQSQVSGQLFNLSIFLAFPNLAFF